ncbi:MAG: hypothetical protein KDB03_18145, partial [Planctomycetales bacterium]|nr:hypothetical protein [Planctomycetales bacterium]
SPPFVLLAIFKRTLGLPHEKYFFPCVLRFLDLVYSPRTVIFPPDFFPGHVVAVRIEWSAATGVAIKWTRQS